jgi:predicted nucleotidyltransferase component of viral defense system
METLHWRRIPLITRKQLRNLHGEGLPLHILEQDYIQSIFLQELYRDSDALVFKGGTYLKHAFGLDRFSEDLDFTSKGKIDIEKTMELPTSRMKHHGVGSFLDKVQEDELSFNARLRYRGPLFDGSERSMGSIDIEISKRGDILKEPRWTRLFFEYPQTAVVNVLGLLKKEVLAEKIRALAMRSKGRDLYDVWFMLKKGFDLDPNLFERKMDVVEWEPIVKISITEEEWRNDLSVLLMNPPDHGDVLKSVSTILKKSGFQLGI